MFEYFMKYFLNKSNRIASNKMSKTVSTLVTDIGDGLC